MTAHGIVERLPHPFRGWATTLGWFLRALWEQIRRDTVVVRASGLAYGSLLAIVPLAAVVFGLLSAFGALEDIRLRVQDELLARFLPSHQDELLALLDRFIANANKLGMVGSVFLIIAAIMLLDGVESNFNQIWGVTSSRRLISKITAYTSVLVFVSLFIGASFSVSARLKAAILVSSPDIDVGVLWYLQRWLLPPFLSLIAFLLMYLIIPFARVHRRSAELGALVGAILWELAKNLFSLSIGRSVRMSTIYGSLAVIPIFLIWLNITWIIVLVGLEVTFTHQHFKALVRDHFWQRTRGGERIALALKVFAAIAEAFDRGRPPPTEDQLADRFEAPPGAVRGALDGFQSAGLLRRAVNGQDEEGAVPARPLGQVTVADVLRAELGEQGAASEGDEPIARAVDQAMAEFQAAGFAALGDTTFEELVRRGDDEPAPLDGAEPCRSTPC